MAAERSASSATVLVAMFCAALVGAQFVGGRATRDALFLAHLPVTSLWIMTMATAVVSLALVFASSTGLSRLTPAAFVPAAFGLSAGLLMAEWWLTFRAPRTAAVIVYLHLTGLGPILGSGFWLVASEQFDPRSAKRRFGQIAGAGTLGGLVGGILTERIAAWADVGSMLPLLAAINLACAWQTRQLAGPRRSAAGIELPSDLAPPARSGVRALAGTPYLRDLAGLVLLATISAALVDYVFKWEAAARYQDGERLLRFFALFYTASGLITFVVQMAITRQVLERYGVSAAAATPSLAILGGGLGSVMAPGLTSATLVRGTESICRTSLFRVGLELFYTPIPADEKRAAKSFIDVGVDRAGEALGGAMVGATLAMSGAAPGVVLIPLAMAGSAGAVAIASRLNRGYSQALEKSLLERAVEVDLADVQDLTTRTAMLRLLRPRHPSSAVDTGHDRGDRQLRRIAALRSGDPDRIISALQTGDGLAAALVPHVITLLESDAVADHAIVALRTVAEERVGELVDALIDPNQPFAIRRRLARVFSVCVSQRAVDGLLLGLDDLRFEVRFRCGRSLAAVFDSNPRVRIDKDRIFEVVLREAGVARPVWESRRLLDQLDDREADSFVDDLVRGRANQSLAHVFTLLSLVLPRLPLQIAFRGLHTDDRMLRGTSLEYLDGILPDDVKIRLWSFLEESGSERIRSRPRAEILDQLLQSNRSIVLKLEELKRQTRT